jgi:hypothetical protein
MIRVPRPPRPVAPATRKIGVSRDFVLDFNKLAWFYDWELADIEFEKVRIRINQAAMDDVPRLARVIRALELVARHYGWTPHDMGQWRIPLRHPGPDRDFILNLARAIEHGYRQTPDNNHQRLAAWLASRGLDPVHADGEHA